MTEIFAGYQDLMPLLGSALPALLVVMIYGLGARGLRRMTGKGWLTETMHGRVRVLMRWTTFAVVGVLVLQAVGLMNHAWAVITTVAAAVAVGFVAHWSILSNGFGAFLILFYQRFGVGDVVEVLEAMDKPEGIKGRVEHINLFYTSMRELPGDGYESMGAVQVPNNIFFQKVVRVHPRS